MEKRVLLSPADDTASSMLITIQTATTRVKEIVTSCVSKGISDEELTVRLNKEIATECRKIGNPVLREQVRKSLISSAKKWHYELKRTYNILERNFLKQAKQQPFNIDIHNLLKKTPFEKQAEFRRLLDDGTNPGIPVIKDYQKSVRLAVKAISADPPKIVTTKDGKSYVMPARLRAELAVRYAAAVENLQRLIDEGVLFCWITSHANCSPRCASYQGKLYSLFQGKAVINGKEYGESGTIDGIPYRPINEALAGPKNDGNGCISGYNCRHRAIEYEKGSRPPQDFTEAQIKRAYAIDKKQRAYENQIRHLKTEEKQLRACGMEKEASAIRKKWQAITKEYKIYSVENDRAFYPYRYVIDRSEEDEIFILEEKLKKSKQQGNKKEEKHLTNYKNQFIMEQERVRQTEDFVFANTVQEAEQYMKKRAKDVSYEGITNVKSLNQINRTYAYLSDKYGLKQLNEVSTKIKNNGAFAESHGSLLRVGNGFANNPTNKTVLENSRDWVQEKTKKLNEAKELFQNASSIRERNELKIKIEGLEEKLKYSRHNVIYEDKEVESVVTHEVGHIIAEQTFQQLSRSWANGGSTENIRNTFNRAKESGDIYKISMYASKDVFEFFAESFTIYEMRKEKLPAYIEEMVTEAIK